MPRRRFSFLLVSAGFMIASLSADPAAAQRILDGPDDHCRLGDALANVKAYYQRGHWGGQGKSGYRNSRENTTTDLCSFRTFFPTDICFCELDEALIGGAMYTAAIDELNHGLPAREFLEGLVITDTMIRPEGLAVERFETAIRGYAENTFFDSLHSHQNNLQKQFGLIFRGLPAGNYLLLHKAYHPLVPEIAGQNELLFRVLKHSEAHLADRGNSFGSVTCPVEQICDDGTDDDGDEITDCSDRDCRYREPCFGPRIMPGRVQAEDYKLGGEGVGYHDTDLGSNGEPYRYPDDVDIWSFGSDVFVAPWTAEAEWTAYDLDVLETGSYAVTARLSCGGGCPSTTNSFTASIDGETVATFAFGDTGDWTTFVDVPGVPVVPGATGIWLEAGPQELRIDVVDAPELSLDYLDFVLAP